MTLTAKLTLSIVLAAGVVLIATHGFAALRPALPKNMPEDSLFVQSGYDIQSNEPTGDWIACQADSYQGTDTCRVTDAHGSVIFQGEFMPINGSRPVAGSQLRLANISLKNLWVDGPAEGGPVPVLPLEGGEVLVPSDDVYALTYRWRNNPEELRRIRGE